MLAVFCVTGKVCDDDKARYRRAMALLKLNRLPDARKEASEIIFVALNMAEIRCFGSGVVGVLTAKH